MPKAPPCSQYEPPAHILVVPKSGRAQYCRKSTAGQKRKPAKKNEGVLGGLANALGLGGRKPRSNKGKKRGPRKPKANRVPRLPAAPVVAMHPMNLPAVRPVTRVPRKPKANRVPRLPAAPVVAMHPMNLPVATRVPRKPKANRVPRLPAAPVVKRHPANHPKAPANPNKGKFLVSMKFHLRNTRNKLNNNSFGTPLKNIMSKSNVELIRKAKLPSNKEFSAYMNQMNGNKKFYERYLENLYSYGNYGETPKVRNYKNATVQFVIDPTKKGFNGNVLFPTAQSIKNNLAGQSLANGIWAAGPGGHGVYPVETSNGLSELGVINFKNVKVSKI